MKPDKKPIRLDEITLMRCILTFLIVFMHAFTCYNGGWHEPAGYVDIPLYKWITRCSFAFTLEAFVFISGYLLAFQRITLNRTGGKWLIVNKLKKLMLPSVIFGAFYFVIFYEYKGIGNALYSIINGCGHMWYLPMLFLCFVFGWLLEQIRIKDGWKLAFLIAFNLIPKYTLPLQLSSAFSFMVYFYLGFLFYKYSDKIKALITPKNLIIAWLVFIVFFVLLRPMRDVLVTNEKQSIYLKMLIYVGNNACQLFYASAGLIAFYGTAVYCTQRHQLSDATKKLAACCFGIYLFQQFVLQLLYYKTNFPLWVGPYWLPWCGFVIAAVVSYMFSDFLLKTKMGRFLIG